MKQVQRLAMQSSRLSLVVLCLLLASAVALKALEPSPILNLQNRTFDLYQTILPRPYEEVPVRIVDIDDASLARIGQWPWPRSILADLVEKLREAGASAIAFDVAFAEADRTSPRQVAASWGKQEALEKIIATLPDYDALFEKSIAAAPVVTGFVLTHDGQGIPAQKSSMALAGNNPLSFIPSFSGSVTSLPGLEAAAKGNGALNGPPDDDGILRKLPLLLRLNEQIYPSLALEALRVAQDASSYIVKTTGSSGELHGAGEVVAIKAGEVIIPTDAHGAQWLYYSPFTSERYISAWQILEGTVDASKLSGHVILVGTSAAGLKDIRATPLNPVVPGVEVFAQALEQAILGVTLSRPDWIRGAEIVLMVIAGLGLLLANAFLPPLWGALCMVAMLGGTAAASWFAFAEHRLLVEPVMPALAVIVIFSADALARYLRMERERMRVRRAFAQYMSPALVEELANHPEKLTLGGESRQLSVMFCDMQDFTGISESLSPMELTALLSRFLTPMTDIVLRHQGTIDKYIGDSIMAFWNAPLPDARHAVHAARAALAMQEALHHLNAELKKEADAAEEPFRAVNASIGINTDECCVGNMGTPQRFNYSALGDGVNLAARLQTQCKHYGVPIILGEATARAIPNLALLEIDLIRVKGKRNVARIYTLLGDEGLADSMKFRSFVEQHAAMLEAYREGQWDKATDALKKCRQAAESVSPSLNQLYARFMQRMDTLRRAASSDWDGIYEAGEK